MRGRDGEEDEAVVRGSRDGEVEDAEKGLDGDVALFVPFLLGDPPWVEDDSLLAS